MMFVGIGILDVFIAESRSLKDKRGVLKSMIKRTQNEFNISIAEVGHHDDWKRGEIGFSIVGNDKRYINSKLDKILRFIDDLYLAEVLNCKVEITSFADTVEWVDSEGMDSDEFQKG
jgi:uncharacterized protein YlxP (DUF503 family)